MAFKEVTLELPTPIAVREYSLSEELRRMLEDGWEEEPPVRRIRRVQMEHTISPRVMQEISSSGLDVLELAEIAFVRLYMRNMIATGRPTVVWVPSDSPPLIAPQAMNIPQPRKLYLFVPDGATSDQVLFATATGRYTTEF